MTGATASSRAVREDRPAWLDDDRYPFTSRWLDLPTGRVHYVDEGPGGTATAASPGATTAAPPDRDDGGDDPSRGPVVFLHGNPTWSFLYRHLIDGLGDEYRCLAPDLPGFGRSETPRSFSYRPAAYARVVERFLRALDVTDPVLVVHDWGGPLGMDYATRHPDDVGGVVAMNTWCWPRERLFERLSSRLSDTDFLRWLVCRHDAFTRAAVAPVVAARLLDGDWRGARALYRHYTAPFSTPARRTGTWALSAQVGRSRAWLGRLWDRTRALADVPVRLLWGRRDPVHGSFLERWRSAFPGARATVYDVGHFVPEAKGRALVAPVRAFLEGRA